MARRKKDVCKALVFLIMTFHTRFFLDVVATHSNDATIVQGKRNLYAISGWITQNDSERHRFSTAERLHTFRGTANTRPITTYSILMCKQIMKSIFNVSHSFFLPHSHWNLELVYFFVIVLNRNSLEDRIATMSHKCWWRFFRLRRSKEDDKWSYFSFAKAKYIKHKAASSPSLFCKCSASGVQANG